MVALHSVYRRIVRTVAVLQSVQPLGLFAPTADLSIELAWAIVVFIAITGTKIRPAA